MSDKLSFKTSMAFTYGEAAPVSPGIVRVVANNPGPMTFVGTNTYLVGMTRLAVIDPGPDDEAHHSAILRAAGTRPITHILITHAHRDHVGGAARLRASTGAPIYGAGRAPREDEAASAKSGSEYVDHAFVPDEQIGDGDSIETPEWCLTALHTPGHAPDHLCFVLEGRRVLFSGDHVMAWNTTLIAPPEGSMAQYVRSLERLLDRNENLYLPGHGGRLRAPLRMVKAYLLHRRWREQSILAAIRNGSRTVPAIVPNVYPGIDARLTAAASLSVLAHVEHLIEAGLVTCQGPPASDRLFYPAS